jgi:hypothetical protein
MCDFAQRHAKEWVHASGGGSKQAAIYREAEV